MGAREMKQPELECFLEVQGASAPHTEEATGALADELEAWLSADHILDKNEREIALEVARQLRMLGWLISVDLAGDTSKMMDQLEWLVARANDLMTPAMTSGVRRRLTPLRPLPIAALYAEEEDLTVVKKAKWDVAARSTNRLLKKDGSDPPPSRG